MACASTFVRNVLALDPAPVDYRLTIQPDLEKFTFCGTAAILVKAEGTHASITLHCAALELGAISFQAGSAGEPQGPLARTCNAKDETITVTLPAPFTGEGTLHFSFAGPIRDDLLGFYRGRYTDPATGEAASVVMTQFCPVEARKTFPCWDEPARKASFTVSIIAPEGKEVLFNVPPSNRTRVSSGLAKCGEGEPAPGPLVRWDFPTTPIMSTYLVAWAVGNFDYLERTIPKTHKKTPDHPEAQKALDMYVQLENQQHYNPEETVIRIVTTPGKAKEGRFALEMACKSMHIYEQMFGCDYPLPQLDIFASPDFCFDGMENWGLILCRETVVLCEENASPNRLASIATVIVHECAHVAAFGDLVTMSWWRELYLNESFATYITNVVLHKIHPEWELEKQFVYEEGSRAFTLDALRSSHPVEMDIRTAKELDDVFDAISYAKGGTLLRMLMGYLGEETFVQGVRLYVTRHMYGNATSSDLWSAMGEVAGKDLAGMMANWTLEQGFPYISVARQPDGSVELTQHRFLASNDVKLEEDTVIWNIPLTTEMGSEENVLTLLLDARSVTVPAPAVAPAYVKVNKDRTAFCRVTYTEDLLRDLLVNLGSCSALDRFTLLSDYAAFCRGGYCSTNLALSVLARLDKGSDYTVLCEAFAFTSQVRAIVATRGEAAVEAFNAFARSVFAHIAAEVGYTHNPTDSFRTSRLRGDLFGAMVAAADPDALATARKLHADAVTDETGRITGIPGDQRTAVFAVYVAEGGEEALQRIMALAASSKDPMDTSNFLSSLQATKADGAVGCLFKFGLSDKVRAQDLFHLLGPLAANPWHGIAFARELLARWPAVAAKVPGIVQARIINLIRHVTDAAILPKMRAFFVKLPKADRDSIGGSYRQALESVELNSSWAARDGDAIVSDFLPSQAA